MKIMHSANAPSGMVIRLMSCNEVENCLKSRC